MTHSFKLPCSLSHPHRCLVAGNSVWHHCCTGLHPFFIKAFELSQWLHLCAVISECPYVDVSRADEQTVLGLWILIQAIVKPVQSCFLCHSELVILTSNSLLPFTQFWALSSQHLLLKIRKMVIVSLECLLVEFTRFFHHHCAHLKDFQCFYLNPLNCPVILCAV